MEETNDLLDALVNFAEDKDTPFKFDNGSVQQASNEAEKSCQELFKFLKQTLNEDDFQKIRELLNDFNLKQLSYCRETNTQFENSKYHYSIGGYYARSGKNFTGGAVSEQYAYSDEPIGTTGFRVCLEMLSE